MEHRETEEMHEAVDQILRSALIAVGSVQQRLARRRQVAADQARMAAAASRTETDAYTAAQDTMLRQSLRQATDPRWFDTSTPAERVATRDMADRFAEVSPYAKTVLDHIDTEAARRAENLTPPETGGPESTPTTVTTGLGKPEATTAAPATATPPRPGARRSFLRDRAAAATYDKARAADSAAAQTKAAAYQTGAATTHTAPGTPSGHPHPDPAAPDTTRTLGTSYYASDAAAEHGAGASAERSTQAESPPSWPAIDTGPTQWPPRVEPSATAQPPHSGPTIDTGPAGAPDGVVTAAPEHSVQPPATDSGRRRPVAVDTTATEQEVADRLSASRSFPRPMWDRLRRSSGVTLRPGSPTTLPRGRDKGLGL